MSQSPALSVVLPDHSGLLADESRLKKQIADLDAEISRLSDAVRQQEARCDAAKTAVENQREKVFGDLSDTKAKQKLDELKTAFKDSGVVLCELDSDLVAAKDVMTKRQQEIATITSKLAAHRMQQEREAYIDLEKQLREDFYRVAPRWLACYAKANGLNTSQVDLVGLVNLMHKRHGLPMVVDLLAEGFKQLESDKKLEAVK